MLNLVRLGKNWTYAFLFVFESKKYDLWTYMFFFYVILQFF